MLNAYSGVRGDYASNEADLNSRIEESQRRTHLGMQL